MACRRILRRHFFCKNRKPAYYKYMKKRKEKKEMVKYILMPEETIQKIKKGDKFFVDGEFNPNSARALTAAHDAYFWVDDSGMPHWTVDAKEGGCYGYGEICQQV